VTARSDGCMFNQVSGVLSVNSRGRGECEHPGPFPIKHKRSCRTCSTGHGDRSVFHRTE